jgi:hypothetical protein
MRPGATTNAEAALGWLDDTGTAMETAQAAGPIALCEVQGYVGLGREACGVNRQLYFTRPQLPLFAW